MTPPLRGLSGREMGIRPEAGGPGPGTVNSRTAWRELKELFWAHRGRLSLGIVLLFVSRLAGLVLPAASRYFVDHIVVQREFGLLAPLAAAVAAATLVQATTGYFLTVLLGIAAQRAVNDMRRELHAHVLRLPVAQFDATQSGILIARVMSDAEGIRNLLGTGFIQFLGGLVTSGVSLGVLFWLSWKMTVVMMLFLGLLGAGMALGFRKLRPIFRERNRMNAEVTGRLAESLGGIRIVKSYTAERREDLVFTRGVNRLLRTQVASIAGWALVGALVAGVIGAIGVTMIVMGGAAIQAGTMTLGSLAMYALFTGMVAAPMIQVVQVGTQLSEAIAGLDRIRELRAMPTEDEEDANRRPVPTLRGEVRAEEVSFEYTRGVPVLKQVSFSAPPGTTTALVGSSGSGKSTLLGLVTCFNRPTAGRILVDGMDLAGLRLRDYRRHLGLVLQDNFLFDGTILDNIRFSRPDAPLDLVLEVSRIAHCEEFISKFPDGHRTIVGERGVKLSGGQRQRVAIARAILADPTILLLDEATSSLDSESEALIQDGLQALRRGRTTFVIAHRLSTILSADQILVLEAGEIVERGTHRELLEQGGRYRQLYDRQYQLEKNRFVNPGEELAAVE